MPKPTRQAHLVEDYQIAFFCNNLFLASPCLGSDDLMQIGNVAFSGIVLISWVSSASLRQKQASQSENQAGQ
jgi:hypothetical protein